MLTVTISYTCYTLMCSYLDWACLYYAHILLFLSTYPDAW